jgi:hypothetical protein
LFQRGASTYGIAGSPTAVVKYTNRMGDTYYLHTGRTKTGKVRYFVAKTIRQGVRSAMPDGFGFAESINGVVSVSKTDVSAARIPEADRALASGEMARHAHLRSHRIETIKAELIVFEPMGAISEDVMTAMGRGPSMDPAAPGTTVVGMRSKVRYVPVMKFVPSPQPGVYSVYRMTYRGDGGWSWPLASGPLHKLLKRYLRHVGTDQFFELW